VYAEHRTGGTNEYGEDVDEWIAFVELPLRAAIRPISGREYFEAQQTQAAATHEIIIRPVPGLTPAMRFRDPDTEQVFNIVTIARPDERGEFQYVCLCRESV
jgi:SPP1 family predicted phage head-tail adaptor